MSIMPSLNKLQYFLLPACFVLGLYVGILLPRFNIVKKHAVLTFWLTIGAFILMVQVADFIGGDVWARLTFAFAMGYLSFALKLLR
jgi:hypothetical protein